jgi:hypothetical protein
VSKTKKRDRTAAGTAARGAASNSSVVMSTKNNIPSEDELVNDIMNMRIKTALEVLGTDTKKAESEIRRHAREVIKETEG